MKNINDLQIGKAGEYIVCADLILSGHVAFLSEQGLPFDVVLGYKNSLLRIQVKTTRKAKILTQKNHPTKCYQFSIGRNGKEQRRSEYPANSVDLFALVALDSKIIGYVPNINIRSTMNFRVDEFRGQYYNEQGLRLKKEVMKKKSQGLSAQEIAEELGMTLSNVYKYQSNVDITPKGKKSGVYLSELTLDRCVEKLKIDV